MEELLPAEPGAIAFRLKNDPRVLAARLPSPYQQLLAAYARDLAHEPRLADWTRDAIEARLQTEPGLQHVQGRVHRNRAAVLLAFLSQPAWKTSDLLAATGLLYGAFYAACRALRTAGLLRIRLGGLHGSTFEPTAAGEMWLLELVEPEAVG